MQVREAKPKTWIATLLGFLQAPLGFLYLGRPWLALGYLVLQVAVVVVDIYSLSSGLLPFSISWLYMPAGAIHCSLPRVPLKNLSLVDGIHVGMV